MCRIEEKVYRGSDGRSRTFQDTFECDRARRRGKRCSKPEKRVREYVGAQPIARDDASSPASNNPPTPTGIGNYVVEERRPSGSGRRPSLKVPAEIVIQIGGSSRKNKDKKYPQTYVSKSYKRSSLGAASNASDVAVESPGSDASYPIRTGLPETAVPQNAPFGQSHGYTTRHIVPQGHRHTASSSSVTTSQTPSLYTTSETEPESPSAHHPPEYPRTIVHNTRPAPSSTVATRGQASPQSTYHTRIEIPQSSSRDHSSSQEKVGDYPVDLHPSPRSHTSSNASSSRAAAPEISERAIDRERRRKKEDEKKEQEENDRRYAENLAKQQEQAKQVRFAEKETGRYEERDRLRKEQKLAESEKHRAEEREKERQRKREQEKRATKEPEKRPTKEPERRTTKEPEKRPTKEPERRTTKEPEKRATKKPEREKTQPPTRDFPKMRPGHSRRNSMTQADIDERDRLLLQEKMQMSLEREAAEQREREERAAELRQQQYSTRPQSYATGPYPVEETRPSSGKRRGSISTNPPPVGSLGRTNSTRRASIVQPNPPPLTPLTTTFAGGQQQSYSTRPPSSHANTQHYTAQNQFPSARYSPSQMSVPFAQPRTSNTNLGDNPFAAPSTRPIHPSIPPVTVAHQHQHQHQYPPRVANDAWDTHGMHNALPTYPPAQPAQYAGYAVDDRANGHGRAQQATRNMYGQVNDEWR